MKRPKSNTDLLRGIAASDRGSEPIICNAFSVSRQIVKGVEAVKMVYRQVRHGLGFGEPHVDRQATSSLAIGLQRPPKRHAPASWAKMKSQCLAADVGLRRA